MKRLIAAIAAALMLAVGVPGVANANGSPEFLLLAAGASNVAFSTTSLNATEESNGSYWYYNEASMGFAPNNVISQTSADTCKSGLEIPEICDVAPDDGSERFSLHTNDDGGWRIGTLTWLNDSTTYSKYFYTSDSPTFYPSGPQKNVSVATVTSGGWTLCYQDTFAAVIDYNNNLEGLLQYCTGAYIMYAGGVNGLDSMPPSTDPLTTSTPTLKRNGISFTPDNFDPTCAYEISTTAGTVKQNPVTGEVNVYGVGSGTSVSVTITDCTGATATVSGKATAATAPVQTLTKPTVATTADTITCTAGTSSVNPTSIAYTLLVDGVAVSTRFSDGAIAPSLVATTAAQNLYTGATLSKASWTVDPAWAGKSYSCTTTSYAAGAVGIANS
jgi:hypothetical protein